MEHIHAQQTDLEHALNEYPVLAELKTRIKPYEDLWKLRNQFDAKCLNEWINSPLGKLDPEVVQQEFTQMHQKAQILQNTFAAMPTSTRPRAVAQALVKLLLKFKESVPIIQALCNPALSSPGLDDTNSQEIFDTLTFVNDEGQKLEEMTLQSLRNYEVEKYKDKLEEISERASKEFSNHKTMVKMKDDWAPLEFTCQEVPGKDSYILNGEAVELIQTTLDDHIIKTQTMKGSPFAKFMLPQIVSWENSLIQTQDNLDLWLKVQAVWMYLEPVFSSEDIISQMPVEGSKFKEVNIAWHNLMNRINEDPRALTVIEIEELG